MKENDSKKRIEELRKKHSTLVEEVLGDMNYEQVEKIRKALTGATGNMKRLTSEQETMLNALALWDYRCDMDAEKFRESLDLDKLMKDLKNEVAVTCLYLYANWRAFATFSHNEELADKYQAICDEIDDYVFDNWDEEKLEYFVSETD